MPINKKLYPSNWKKISLRIRERAKWRCEFCGAKNGEPHPITGAKVVLTVAHLDQNPQNCADENLRALCQRCHLFYDKEQHRRNAAKTRYKKIIDSGQMELIPSKNFFCETNTKIK